MSLSTKLSRACLPLLLLAAVELAGESPRGAAIRIDPEKTIGAVNRDIIGGHNLVAANWEAAGNPKDYGRTGNGLWNPATRRPVAEVVALFKELGVRTLRYPGGCMTHNFKWQKTVGPIARRPDYTFGLMEYLAFCDAVNAAPQLCVSAYEATPQDAADLVEFLNAEASPARPWAMKRAQWGHPEPCRAKYFEMGNESYHGNHGAYIGKPFKKLTPEEYADWFNKSAALMRKVDASIKIGAILKEDDAKANDWNKKVLPAVGDNADFIVGHTYTVGFTDWKDSGDIVADSDFLTQACMASANQMKDTVDTFNALVKAKTGKQLPLAITEYNASILNDKKPIPYRYSLAAALFCADYVRFLLMPENHVLLANYWSCFNGYWGFVHGPADPSKQQADWEKNPAFHLYCLWAAHFGDRLTETEVVSPEKTFQGGYSIPPCGMNGDTGSVVLTVSKPSDASPLGYGWKSADGVFTLRLENYGADAYPEFGSFKTAPGNSYRLSYEGKIISKDKVPINLGLGLVDGRGWPRTGSAVSAEGVETASDWTAFSNTTNPAPGCEKMNVLFRLRGTKETPVTAEFQIRNIKVEKVEGLPAYKTLTAISSVSTDGKKLYLLVFNKDLREDIGAAVEIADKSLLSAKIWTVTGPPTGTNTDGKLEVFERLHGEAVPDIGPAGFKHSFPPCSMSAIEMERKTK